MNSTRIAVVLSVLALLPAPAARTADVKAPAKKVAHRFLATDNRNFRVVLVSPGGKIEWEYPNAGVCNDAWLLANGNVLFASKSDGVRLVVPDLKSRRGGKIVWHYRAPRGCEVHGCQPLPDGKALVARCGKPPKLIELDSAGKVVKEIALKSKSRNAHGQMRQARKTPKGTYLVTMLSEHAVHEVDAAGKVVRTIKVPGNPFAAIALPNGNVLIACGDGRKLIEVDPTGKVVWQIGENDLPGQPLRFVAGLHRLPNGNTVVANWGGHGKIGTQPHLFEVTRDKKVVWQVFDNKQFKTLSSVHILDDKTDPATGKVLR